MRNFNLVIKATVLAGAFIVAASCCNRACIDAVIADAPGSDIELKMLDVNTYRVLDTLTTDAEGKLSFKVDVKKGQPEFVYLFRGGRRIAAILASAGDRLKVTADTLGGFDVTGSADAELYAGVEKDFAAFKENMAVMTGTEQVKEYIRYYRDRTRFIMENSKSLAIVPVMFQKFGDDLYVFAQETDAIHFRNMSDSLEAVFPDSRYVKALRAAADDRSKTLEFNMRLRAAEEVDFPDIALPDINGEVRRLSDVEAKVIMVYFWSPEVPLKNIFDLDILNSVYKDYHNLGFEIYQVGIHPDKTAWASTAKGQGSPWINVCDIAAGQSRYLALYNVTSLPMMYFICNGEMSSEQVTDEASTRALLDKYLK